MLQIRDAGFRKEKMLEILSGRGSMTELDEELYWELMEKVVVYKDDIAKVIFQNGSSTRTGY